MVTVYRGHRRTLFYLSGIISLFIICIGISRNNSLVGTRARARSNPCHWALHALLHMASECVNHSATRAGCTFCEWWYDVMMVMKMMMMWQAPTVCVGMMRHCVIHSFSTCASLSAVNFSSALSSASCWNQTWLQSAGKPTRWSYTSTGWSPVRVLCCDGVLSCN